MTTLPEICIQSKTINCENEKSGGQVLCMVDCRIYREFINITSIKLQNFMKEIATRGVAAQVNKKHCGRYISYDNNFEAMKHVIISSQFKKALQGLCDCQKFTQNLFN